MSMPEEVQQPTVGRIVHVIHEQQCFAAIVTDVGDAGVGVFKFPRPGDPADRFASPVYEAYNPLHGARPTSGWHWPLEHNETS
jgi:hypothetical protein